MQVQAIMEAVSQTGTNIRGADLHSKDGSVFGTHMPNVRTLLASGVAKPAG